MAVLFAYFSVVLIWATTPLAIQWSSDSLSFMLAAVARMSIALAIAVWGMKTNFLKSMLGSQLDLPDPVWHKLNVAWIAYTAFMSISNAYVAMFFTEEGWLDFKLWGYVFPVAFLIGQGFYIAPHLRDDEKPDKGPAA